MDENLNLSQLEEIEAKHALEMKMWTSKKFLKHIESYTSRFDVDVLDAVTDTMKEYDITAQMIQKELMSERLYYLLRESAEERKLLKKSPRLEFV